MLLLRRLFRRLSRLCRWWEFGMRYFERSRWRDSEGFR